MTVLAYPRRAVLADYARAGAGLVILGTPLVAVDTAPVVTALLAVGAVLFLLHGLRTLWLHRLRIRVDGDGVGRLCPVPRTIAWRELRGVRLAYYSTRRDRSGGWMQLTLVGAGGRVAVDSRLDGFATLTARAVTAAAANGIALDAATAANLAALRHRGASGMAGSAMPDLQR